ncbi:MAG: DNA recombination protein RmuC [Phycisphaeraceae bacterium]|nr:MAG: DNA recombination protein RmuC [Phycisphaeraceae bacterium]
MGTLAIVLGVGLVVALGVAVWLGLGRERLRAETVQARRDAEQAEARRREEVGKLEGMQANLRGALEAAETSRRELEVRLGREEEQRDSDRRLHAERERRMQEEQTRLQNWLREREEELKAQFESLSGKVLDVSAKRFLEQAKENFASQMKQAESDLEQRKKAVDALVKPIGETLEKTRERLDKLGERVEMTTEASANLRTSTEKLVQAFSRPEVRGRYGEIQLRRIAELAGMSEHCDYDEQSSTQTDEGRLLRPDMIVKLPNHRVVVVDAKCNIDAYVRAVEVVEADERERLLDKFASDVAGQATKLARKGYWEQYQGSPDFVVMFVPGDHFLDAAMSRRPDLIEKAAESHVILASPATLIGLLRAVAVGWREHALTEQAQALFELGKELHERAAVAYGHIDDLGKALERATRKYNEAVGSIQSRLTPTLRRFEEAGAKSGKELAEPPQINVLPREAGLGLLPESES